MLSGVATGDRQPVSSKTRLLQRLQVRQLETAASISVVDSIVLSSPWLSPGNDTLETISFSFRVQAPSRVVVLATLPAQTVAIDSVLSDSTTGTGQTTLFGSWDGKAGNGTTVADGPYDFLFMEIDTLQNVHSNRRQFTVDTVAPVIDSVQIVPRSFAPSAPGAAQNLEVSFRVSQSQAALDAVGVDLIDDEGFLAVPLVGAFAGDGDYVARCYDCAESLSDGISRVEVWSIDPAANENVVIDSIDVNLLGPDVTLSHPTSSDEYVTQQADSLVGSITDRQTVVSVSMLVSGAMDTTLSLMTTPAPDSTQLALSMDVSQLFAAEGVYELTFVAVDDDGVSDSTRTLTYTVDRTAPAKPTLSPPLPATTRSPAIPISVLVDSTAEALLVNGQSNAINGQSVLMFPQFPLVPGVNNLNFQVVDFADNRSPSEVVSVFRETTEGLSAPERFRAGQQISLDAGSIASRVQVRILATDGALVRSFLSTTATREFAFTWDLTTPEGIRVRNGPYLVVATVHADNNVRHYRKMIAVVE